MAFTFVVETGDADPDSTSYCDVEFANDYMEANAFASEGWLALDEDVKERLLVRSSRILDIRLRWNGRRAEPDSGLKWPRAGCYDQDGFLIADTTIPTILKQAVVEFAGYLMNDDWSAPRDNDQYKELSVDVIDIKFNTDFRRAYIPDTVTQMLSDLGSATTGARPNFKPIRRT